jgi:alpha-glucosidase
MYPERVSIIRDAIKFRYVLIPYLYQLSFISHIKGTPVIRPLVMEFQSDSNAHQEAFTFLLGPSLLVTSIFLQGETTKTVYLPLTLKDNRKTWWFNLWEAYWTEGGFEIEINVPLEQHGGLFVREGSLIPTGKCMNFTGESNDDFRLVWTFPPPMDSQEDDMAWETVLYEDDGESQNGPSTEMKIIMRVTPLAVEIDLYFSKTEYLLPYKDIYFVLPKGEKRPLKLQSRFVEPVAEELLQSLPRQQGPGEWKGCVYCHTL